MGEAELDKENHRLTIHADLVLYGNAASDALANEVAASVSQYWNEPGGQVKLGHDWYNLVFNINGIFAADLTESEVLENTDPRKNYFRVEAYAKGNISFVDGINCNTGYFKLDNLLNNSTTAAHEFGHTIGLEHPENTDIRGMGQPGIMYPRGTIVDNQFQYDPNAQPLQPGGTINPMTRKVTMEDIANLNISRLSFNENGFAILGEFSSVWHDAHEP